MIKAFIYGGLVGAALGICYAPQKGEETRRQLSAWWDEFQELAQANLQSAQSNYQSVQSNLQSLKGDNAKG